MKKLLSLGVLSLFLVMPTLSSSAPSGSQDHDLARSGYPGSIYRSVAAGLARRGGCRRESSQG
jgi:hypothetical protein